MQTLYAACLRRVGLSQAEAAALHGVALDTVKKWSVGKNRVPAGVWAELREREVLIAERSNALADALAAAIEKTGAHSTAINAVVDDAVGLIALADFVLNSDVPVGEIMVRIV